MASTKRVKKTIGADAQAPAVVNPISQLKGMAIPPVTAGGSLSTTPAATPGWLSHVKSTVKGGVDVLLGSCTAIVSTKNRRGKTAVLDTVRLLIDGKHAVGAHNTKDLSNNDVELVCVGEGVDCNLHYEVPQGKSDGIHQMTLKPGIVAPCIIESATELLKSTPTARDEFVMRFCGDVSVDSPTDLTPDQAKKWNEGIAALTQEAKANGKPVVQYVVANIVSFFRRMKLAASKAAGALQGEIMRTMESTAADIGSTEIVTEQQLAAARATLNAAVAARALGAASARKPVLESEIESAMTMARGMPPMPPEDPANLKDLLANIGAAEKSYSNAQELFTKIQGGPQKLIADLRQLHLDRHFDSCLVCCKPLTQDEAKANAASAKQIVADIDQAIREAQTQREAAQSILNSARNTLTMANQEQRRIFEQSRTARQNLANQIHTKQAELKGINDALAQASTVPTQTVEEAQAAIDKLHAARTRQLASSQSLASKSSLQQGQSDYAILEAKSAAVVQQAIEAKAAAVVAAVQRYMPEGFQAALLLRDVKGDDAYRWEVIGADGRGHRCGVASGSEWGALMVAVACVWAEGQNRPRILLLDDADLSAFAGSNATALLDNIQKRVAEGVITQCVVTSLNEGTIPAGWHKVVLA